MEATQLTYKIQLRRDIASNWTSENPILSNGEKGLETDTGREKNGDGITAWNNLGYISPPYNNIIAGDTIYGGTVIDNLNTINKNGFYTCYSTATGVPSASYSWFVTHQNSNVGTASATQRAVAYTTTPVVYERTKSSGTWNAWELQGSEGSVTQLGTCSTASATAEKAVTLSGFTLATGSTIEVTFTNANTAASPTLNVNSTGAKAIYNEAGTAVSATNPAYFPAGSTVEFIYNGTNWVFKKRVVENYVNGTSWYRVCSDGWIEQGGKVTVIGGGTTVTLLKSFSDTNYAVLATAFNAPSATCNFQSSTTLKITANNVGDVVFWEAKGY